MELRYPGDFQLSGQESHSQKSFMTLKGLFRCLLPHNSIGYHLESLRIYG